MNLVCDSPQTTAILELIAPSLADLGYEVVRVRMTGDRRAVLQIMIERSDGQDVVIDDCTLVSHTVSALLDVADPIPGAYELEVSSPGIDRPLTRPEDFDSYRGYEAKVELKQAIEGRRRYRGRLLGLDGDVVRLAAPEDGGDAEGVSEYALPLAEIAKAKLVMTDDLLAMARQGRMKQG